MKLLFTIRQKQYRPEPFPCPTIMLKTTWYLFGVIPWRKKYTQLK